VSQFPPALAYLRPWEDPSASYGVNPDACPEGCQGPCFAICGINSGEFPEDYRSIAAVQPAQRAPLVSAFYLVKFWTPMRVGGIADQELANRVFDCGVNEGPETSIMLLQKAVNAIRSGQGIVLAVDGILGPETLSCANLCEPEALLASFRTLRAQRYEDIAAANPADARFLPDWLARAKA
jgi:hypothetical protein